jgi:hypothetical protein
MGKKGEKEKIRRIQEKNEETKTRGTGRLVSLCHEKGVSSVLGLMGHADF